MMANTPHSAKDGIDWTREDLNAYRIECHPEDPLTFFGVQALPHPQVEPDLLTAPTPAQAVNDSTTHLLYFLDDAMTPGLGDATVVEFTYDLFKAIGYFACFRLVWMQRVLSLFVCGEFRRARMNLCLVVRGEDGYDILLLAQESKPTEEAEDGSAEPAAPLVAGAIAVFEFNNKKRVMAGLEPLETKVMPGIVMVGTSPTFYKIPITGDLLKHVGKGTCPSQTTHVTYCQPPVPRPELRNSEGMKPLDNRLPILSCYEAFKAVIGI